MVTDDLIRVDGADQSEGWGSRANECEVQDE